MSLPHTDQVLDEYGRPVPGASIYVTDTLTLAYPQLTSDGSTPLSQPVTTDEFGFYTYYANAGLYHEDIWYSGKLRYKGLAAVGTPPQWKGDPGGNAAAIGTYANAAGGGLVIAAGTNRVRTSGYTTEGDGGDADFTYSATMPADGPKFQDASGRWFGIERHQITSASFGAIAGVDAGAALNAFFAFAVAHDECRVLDLNRGGSLTTSIPVVYDNLLAEDVPREIRWGGFSLTATAPMGALLTLKNDFKFNFIGRPTLIGTGGSDYSTRTVDIGLWIETSARADFTGVNGNFFRYAAVFLALTNSNLADLGDISANDCGSGQGISAGGTATWDLTATWSAPVNSGSTLSTGQRTTINVDVLPPVANDAYARPTYVTIDGLLHQVMTIDRTGGTLAVHPWIPSTASPGTLHYFFGGGLSLGGGDNSVIYCGLDVKRCGIGMFAGTLYSPQVYRLVSQSCGIAASVADNPVDAHVGGRIDGFYCENNFADFNRGTFSTINVAIGSEYALNFDKILATGYPRDAAGVLIGNSLLDTVDLFKAGVRYPMAKSSARNQSEVSSKLSGFTPTLPRGSGAVYRRDGWNIQLGAFSDQVNELFGMDSAYLGFIGPNASGAFTANFVFKPALGDAVNGGPAEAVADYTTAGAWATFSPKGPVLFLIYRDVAAKMWWIWPVGGIAQGAAVTSPAAMTYVAATGGAVIDAEARAAQVQLAADVTAIRTQVVALLTSLRAGGEIAP